MNIEELQKNQIDEALILVWDVFSKYVAPGYSKEGNKEFYEFIRDNEKISALKFYGAYIENVLAGVIAMRGNHISLFFVKEQYHKQGIGKKLFEYILNAFNKNDSREDITVNSSPYAVNIYAKLGFKLLDEEQVTNGIRYTPMIYINNKK